jgi:hypothetical protein
MRIQLQRRVEIDVASLVHALFREVFGLKVPLAKSCFCLSYVSVFLSNSSGPHLQADFKLPIVDKYAGKPAVADINRDGYLDIVVPNLGGASGAKANSSTTSELRW